MGLIEKLKYLTSRMYSGAADIDISPDKFIILLQDNDYLDTKSMYTLLEEENIKILSVSANNNRIQIIGRFEV